MLETVLTCLLTLLGSEDFRTRENAHALLAAYAMRCESTVWLEEYAAGASDVEVKRRCQALVREYRRVENLPSLRVFLVERDESGQWWPHFEDREAEWIAFRFGLLTENFDYRALSNDGDWHGACQDYAESLFLRGWSRRKVTEYMRHVRKEED